ncbi:MAG: DNA polymerase III subunit gamma/tau [Rubripirellula sp.]
MSEASPASTADSVDNRTDSYVVVARRYRPRNFEELVGQQHVGQALRNAIETNRVGHAYLFTGARGVGKTSTARIFAKSLNHPGGPSATPDQESEIAKAIDSGEDVDVIEIDGASNRGIDEIRSLRANAGVRPSRSRYKIYIIDEVHMLTTPAFNALLKTLEEPPEHVKFIFCTTDPEKIPITVLSRCQRFDFAPVEIQEIVARLKFIVDSEKAEADEAALELIARRAAGSMRDSQSLLEQVLSFSTGQLTADHVHSMLGTANDERLHQLAHALADRDAAAALKLMDKAVDEGVDAGKLAEQLLGYFRDLMAVTVGCDASMLRHAAASMHSSLSELGNRWGLQTVLAVVGLIDQTLVRTRHSVYARVLLEATLIQICNLPDLQRIADLADAAGRYQSSSRTASGGTSEKKKASQPVIGSTPSISELSKPQETRNQPPSENRSETASKKSSEQEPSHQESTAPSVATPINQVTWTPTNANKVWQIVISRLESMSESLARMVEKVEATGSNTAKLHLPHNSSLAKRRLETPEQRDAIMQVLKEITGGNISFEVVLQNPPTNAQQVQQKISKPSRMQRMREIENNQLIKDCLEVFEAEIINVDQN